LTARANQLAAKVVGVAAAVQDYSTSYVDTAPGQPAHWIASQTLEVRGQSGESVLDLLG
jgi:hypothetical protein